MRHQREELAQAQDQLEDAIRIYYQSGHPNVALPYAWVACQSLLNIVNYEQVITSREKLEMLFIDGGWPTRLLRIIERVSYKAAPGAQPSHPQAAYIIIHLACYLHKVASGCLTNVMVGFDRWEMMVSNPQALGLFLDNWASYR